MANSKLCQPCKEGRSKECLGRWQAPSDRTVLSKGTRPRQSSYTYKCPNLKR